jgi:hypothetical protein
MLQSCSRTKRIKRVPVVQDGKIEDGDYPLQIVGEDVEAHFDTDPFQPSGQEVRCSHPGLDGSSGHTGRQTRCASAGRRSNIRSEPLFPTFLGPADEIKAPF